MTKEFTEARIRAVMARHKAGFSKKLGQNFLADPEAIRLIAEGGVLAPGGIIVAEHRKQIEMPDELHGFTRTKERRYGVVKLSIYNNM